METPVHKLPGFPASDFIHSVDSEDIFYFIRKLRPMK